MEQFAVTLIACLAPLAQQPGGDEQPVFVSIGEVALPDLSGMLDGELGDMTRMYLLREMDAAHERWCEEYEQRKTPEAVAAYQERLRGRFLEALGGLPERTPLEAQVTGIVPRSGYRIEKVVFQSMPGLYVTGALFIPENPASPPPHPGVLVPCGHSANGKAHDTYQSMGAALALAGMVAFVFDPIDQGERGQYLDASGKPPIWGTKAHTMVGIGCTLLGWNTARYEIWDGIRAIDYLQSRPEVDPNRIGCTGNSGGGTQTSFLMALDDRIQAAAPSCYLNRLAIQAQRAMGDSEQNIFGQLAWGMDHADYLMMRAPIPIIVLAATEDFFDIHATWYSFRYAKRLYTRMGFAERVEILENDAGHNYDTLQREGGVRWLARWLLGRDEAISEPPIELVPDEELNCTPDGQVMLLPGARSVYDINEAYARELAEKRRALWAQAGIDGMRPRIREVAGIRPVADLARPEVRVLGEIRTDTHRVEQIVLVPEEGILLPGLFYLPTEGDIRQVMVFLNDAGVGEAAQEGGALPGLLEPGRAVLAVDPRGVGATRQTRQGKFGLDIGLDWEDNYIAYLLGRSYVGMRAEDVLVCARWATERTGLPSAHLTARGDIGIPCLHAAALEPELFDSVRLESTLVSWSNVIETRITRNQIANMVHGALAVYDLPELVEALGSRVVAAEPVDALGRPYARQP